MSALHRLKAYFGMVPVDEFHPHEFYAEEFHAGEFHADEFAHHHSDHRSSYLGAGHDSRGYDPGCDSSSDRAAANFTAPAGHPLTPRTHAVRPPSWAPESWAAESRAAQSRTAQSRTTDAWATETPVRGSLAIDTATIEAGPAVRRPVASQPFLPTRQTGPVTEDLLGEDGGYPFTRVVTLHPNSYNEARPIGERYREGNPVIMNLTEMQDRDAKRLVDFAAGLAFALRGSIDKVTNKVFLLSPPNVDVSAEDRRRIAEGRFVN
jgi:cell division inhibitor SepF